MKLINTSAVPVGVMAAGRTVNTTADKGGSHTLTTPPPPRLYGSDDRNGLYV